MIHPGHGEAEEAGKVVAEELLERRLLAGKHAGDENPILFARHGRDIPLWDL
jgi:hypothetical protein